MEGEFLESKKDINLVLYRTFLTSQFLVHSHNASIVCAWLKSHLLRNFNTSRPNPSV